MSLTHWIILAVCIALVSVIFGLFIVDAFRMWAKEKQRQKDLTDGDNE